ncbi:MAG TPA: choice-of-anchor L domain-containing protein [Bacteroidia bacterium]|nr:choice-of-anchor L domain-containing protein [Bacteroidia bacterium]HQW17139.1 choice-of-anchor L domain-containing protein [Bacteroidia bacterium]HRA59195.1 choice-of-anchor L domain-containing protein [Bacteroidia bacterium]HRC14588.1 choice-of-anchor L domain-containing protein [Bacteroidia bacterium]
MKILNYLCTAFILLLGQSTQAQLTVTSGNPAAAIVDTLVGTGVSVANVTYTGNANSKGTFRCTGGCNLGITRGVFLSTGNTGQMPTSPPSDFHSSDMSGSGDAQLNLIVSPNLTQDAAVLEFDFTPAADSVGFKFVFASEEYNDYVNTAYNDVFAFYISGPGIPGSPKNLALIPGTSIPVSINNVNNGNSAGAATGPCNHCANFVDNVPNGGTANFFDGFTTVISAGIKVMPCQTYHMKFAIADVNDGVFDSGVFLEAKSFSSIGNVGIAANGVQIIQNLDTVYACDGDSVVLTASPAGSYNWNNGQTTQTIVVTQANITPSGVYQYAVLNSSPACFASSKQVKVIFVTPTATITPLGSTALCPGGSVVLQANPGSSYLWSNGATSDSIVVSAAGTYTVTVTQFGNCYAVSTPVVVTQSAPVAAINGVLTICSGSNTTLTATAGASYLWSTGATTQSVSVGTSNTYTVTVTYSGGCTATASVNVTANTNPVPSITGNNSICQGQSSTINAGSYAGYLWSTGATAATINVNTAGNYSVTVTDANGCTGTASFNLTVNANPTPTITGVTSFCAGGNSTLNAGGGYTNYLWSGGATTQTINVTAGGNYAVTVTNAAGCTATTNKVITVNALPVPSVTGTLSFCAGKNTTLTVPGSYTTYQWSNGATTSNITVSTASTFTVTVTDANGCTGSKSATTTINTNPVPSIIGNSSICQGQSSTINAGSYAGYSWSTGATAATINVNTAGNYSVTVTDANGCTGTASFNLTVNANPTPTITGVTSFCAGGNSTLNAGGGYTNYLWSGGATTQTINVTAGGNYAVTVTNASGCTATTNKVITVNALPVPSVTGTLAFCSGKNTTLTVPGSYASYQWSNGATTSNITVNTASTFTVTVTDANGCTGSKSATTTINTNPVPSITGNSSICQGQSSTINAGSYAGYSWSTGAATATINVNTAGNYSVTVTDANGCTGTASFNLAVNAIPTPTITGVTSFCAGGNSTLNAGGGYTNYLWNGGATTQTINVTAGGNYAVTVTNAAGCTATTNKVITVNALPVPAISGPAGICPGASANLFAGSYASYLWSNGNTTPSITTNVSGNYTVTVTDANGCVGSSNYNLLAFQNPIPVISGTAAICQNQNSVLDAGSFASWQWSTGAVSQTISVTQSGTYSVTVTNTDGCVASTSFNVVVNPLPVPIISGTSAFCSGNSSVLTTGGGSFTSYQWNTSATSNAITVTAQGNYVVTVTDANGCTASTNQAVTVWNLPTPVITGNNSICSGTQTTLSAGNYSAYQWSTGATTDSIAVSNGANYIVTVTDVNGCSGTSAPFALTINQLPTAIISGSTAICIGQSTSLQIQFTGTAPYSYRYSDGTSVSAILNTNNSAAQILVTPGTTTDYTLTQINDANCTGNVSGVARVVVNPLPQPVISGSAGECDGITATLTTGNFAAYLWSTGATSQSIAVNSSGSYVCTVTSTAGCKASAIHNFEAYPVPVVSFTNDSSLTCELPIINFTNTSQYQLGSVFEWNIDNTIYNSLNATHQFSGSGSYTVSLTITSPKNCVGEAIRNVNITVFPLPQASFTIAPDQAPLFNSEVAFGDASANAVSWLWDFGDGDTSTLQNVSHFYADPGKYNAKLYVTNVAGCIDSLAREIFITPFYIPNAFTPNGDGRNETFFDPGYATNVQSLTMNIYNRWGQLVYTTDNLSKTWDGIDSKGNLSPQGVYVYALKVTTYSGKHYDYTGSVSLIR